MHYDVIIIGGGPTGLACGISLARDGRKVCILERSPENVLAEPPFDGREIALTHHAAHWLKEAGAWDEIPSSAICPMHTARVETGSSHSFPLIFDAPKDGPNALGYMVANHFIRQALYRVSSRMPRLTVQAGVHIEQATHSERSARVVLKNKETLTADLIVAADGRFSRMREAAGIGAIVDDFKRSILVCRVRHPTPHDHTALQWFDSGQTIAFLPIAPDDQEEHISSLVLTLENEDIERLCACDEATFNAEITQRSGGRLGALSLDSKRCSYPLKTVFAHRFRGPRLALIGDAAVGMHPITAHGFNLGLRAQETLARAIADGPGDAGVASVLSRYERQHRRATLPLYAGTNAIATLYTRDSKPAMAVRRLGLNLANHLMPFKKAITGMLMDHKN
ncbi:5-demethoxyubiquinol-8 5-hydroxylase UbiM [Neokomagataea anthophila]|uniref:5-demethoxyubiquinol-8 5-hydroxylase UbiM n=1 Tax=Neokomagataea anthophila TaxID=2826925 RepID=A0ABS5E7G2_9PROT|nr:5-demethoxyubiquinol-8 5-hydroxylase UbiM [Neokomagataea anthophila]MBR0559806.1 5-demethoxyubiquinol-8 5-hydroxylase UbiM [Neokomagataea anthophila]